MHQEIIKNKEGEFEKAVEYFKTETGKLRTGRASAALVENLPVDYYGNKTPLKQVASINIPEPRLIVIQPWDTDSLANIEAAIKMSDLNLNPNNDGKVIRINIPPLNEERRAELVKVLNQKAEEARISIRGIREEIWEEIQELEKAGKITEDDKFQGKERLQEAVDEYNKKVEDIRKRKEEEIKTV
ncbi:ribosome recycling factor [bacterium]|nr:ribosome recycling factor [bacterium]